MLAICRSTSVLLFLTVLFLLTGFSFNNSFAQYTCLPTCNANDGRFFLLAGPGIATINNTDAFLRIQSPGEVSEFEIGIFDGEGLTSWDGGAGELVLEYSLIPDPNLDGAGNDPFITLSSDGSFGQNTGNPMTNNAWFNFNVQNIQAAQTDEGNYSYILRVRNLTANVVAVNSFKIRTTQFLSIPAGETFNYMAPLNGQEDFDTIYPNADLNDPACFDINKPGFFCNPDNDPNCCLSETTYDGSWSFYFFVPPDIDTLNIWDGDLDFGSSTLLPDGSCLDPDGVRVDTDDPNTPIPLPPWAIGTEAITQGVSSPTDPADDSSCFLQLNRTPSVVYFLEGPNGESYLNNNPSGNIEWELFNISTKPFDPSIYDIHVDSIEEGLWKIRTSGNDMQNLNSFTLPYSVIGVDEDDDPVPFDDTPLPPEPPTEVPTLSEWGLLAFAGLSLLISLYSLRFRKKQRA